MKIIWLTSTPAFCFFCFAAGVFGGMYLERLNADFNLCADETSGRYIHDHESRQQACGPNTR